MNFLSELGIYFAAEQLKDIPLPTWFGASAGSAGHIKVLFSKTVISASVKASQLYGQMSPVNINRVEGLLMMEDVESIF